MLFIAWMQWLFILTKWQPKTWRQLNPEGAIRNPGARLPGIRQIQFCHLLAEWPWVNYLPSGSQSFHLQYEHNHEEPKSDDYLLFFKIYYLLVFNLSTYSITPSAQVMITLKISLIVIFIASLGNIFLIHILIYCIKMYIFQNRIIKREN